MLDRLLSSLLEAGNAFADVRGGLSGIMNAKKVDITHCCYEAETSLGKVVQIVSSSIPLSLSREQSKNDRMVE